MTLSEKAKADLELWKEGEKLAKKIGFGYRVYGIGPGVGLYSEQFPRFPIDLPLEVVKRLLNMDQ